LTTTLTGTGTNWVNNQTTASFGGEITVNSVTVSSATSATANITISPTAALGPRTVTTTTGSEVISGVDVFAVNAITPPGSSSSIVSTLAGSAGNPGFTNGTGVTASFRSLAGIASAPNETVYVADAGNHAIRKVDANGAVTTPAGSGSPGYVDAQGSSAQFNNPQGVAVDSAGNVYVADTGNHSIRKVDAGGNVTTVAGDGTAGFTNGIGTAAQFNAPRGVAVDNSGRVYVADTGNHTVRRIETNGNVVPIAGNGTAGSSNGTGTVSRFNGLAGITVDGQTVYVYIADTGNHQIRRLDTNPAVILLAGLDRGFKDGTAAQSRFADPVGIATDGVGHIVIAETTNSLVREVDPVLALNAQPNAVYTLAGTGGRGTTNGAGNVAQFNKPGGVAVLTSSAIIVADTGNNTLRKILLPPVIASINPTQGNIGTAVTLTGNRFDERGPSYNTVSFTASSGTVNATVASVTRSQINVTVPAGAVTGNVKVQTAGGPTNGVTFTVGTTQPPVIASFDPLIGPVGTLVTIIGTNLMVGATNPVVTFAGANSTRLPAQIAFASATQVRVTVPNAAITGVIQLTTSIGMATSAQSFTIAPSQNYSLTLLNPTRTVVQGSNATFVVSIPPQPTFTQMVSLTATGLPSGSVANFSPSQITAGATSTLTIRLYPSLPPTSYSFTVQGVTKVDGSDLTRTVSGSFTVMASGSTTLLGRVLSTEGVPIPDCTVSATDPNNQPVTATTDGAGNFLLIGLQAGPARAILIQPAQTNIYPIIKEPADVAANQSNTVPYTFYLPAIDHADEQPITPNSQGVVQSAVTVINQRVKGLAMTIPQGIRLIGLNGQPLATGTLVSITPVPIDRTPAPLPAGVFTPLVFTSQPGSLCSAKLVGIVYSCDPSGMKIPVTYPNLSGAKPGLSIQLWAFDHDTVEWYKYGLGTVSPDGKTIVPNAGVGLKDFSWHFPAPPSRDGNNGDPGGSCPTTRSDKPVEFTTGVKIETMTDISFGGARGGLELTRTYTSDQAISYGGSFVLNNVYRFGVGTRDNYDVRLIGKFQPPNPNDPNDPLTITSGYLVLPEQTPFFAVGNQVFNGGRLFSYDDTLSGSGVTTFTNTTTAGMLGDTIRRIDAQTLEYRSTRGYILRFEPNPNPGGVVTENYYRLKRIIDRNGNETVLNYNAGTKRLETVTDAVGVTSADGRKLTYSYGAANCAACVAQVVMTKSDTPGFSRSVTYSYGTNQLLTTVTDQMGKEHKYTYDSENKLLTVKDRRSNFIKTLVYDSNKRVISQTFADGGIERYSYTLSGNLVTGITIIDPLGRTMSKRFNAQGYVIEEADPLGQVSVITRAIGTNTATKSNGPCGCLEAERTFDSHGAVLSIKDKLIQMESWQYRTLGAPSDYDPLLHQVVQYTDKRSKTTNYGYDTVSPNSSLPKGNLTSVANAMMPTPQVTTYGYDSFGRLITVTDALSHQSTLAYDANGYVGTQTDALNHTTTFQYDLVGNLKNVFDPLNRETRMVYDNLDRVTETRNPANLTGNPTYTYTYDENGNRLSMTDANLKTWTFTYDAKNRQELVQEPPPINRITRWQYDAADQLLKVISPSGRTMRYAYDQRGQQQTITDGLGNNVNFGYDNRGNLTTLKDQRNNTTTFGYDQLFRLTGRRDPLGRQVTVEYDAVGNVTAQTDRMGRRTTIIYDNINRPTAVNYVDATVGYQYDVAGRWTQVSDTINGITNTTITWQYDNANRVISETTGLGVVSYGYNEANQRSSMTAADRPPVNYDYDTSGQLHTIKQTTLGVEEVFTYGYDTLSRRTQLQRQSHGAGIVTTDYQYDEISRLKRLKHTRVSNSDLHEDFQYEYNLDDEITKITSLASAPLTPQSKTATTADAANRIPQFGTATYSLNQEGQTTAKTDISGTTSYQWDARGRLTQAALPNGQAVNYGYDVLGRRINRAANGVTTTFQYDGADVVTDRESGGSAYDYLNGLGIDDKLRQSGGSIGTLYFLQDHLGSTAALTSASGALMGQQQYEAFGANAGSAQTRYGYTGRERDELTGLTYYRARWFDSSQARFLSEDPIGFDGGLNLYAYVENDPIGFTDPLGLNKRKLHDDLSNLCKKCDTIERDLARVRESHRKRQEEINRRRATGQGVNAGHYQRLNTDKLKRDECVKKLEDCKKKGGDECPEPTTYPARNPEPKRRRDFFTDPPFVPIPNPRPIVRPVPAGAGAGAGFFFMLTPLPPCMVLPGLCSPLKENG
jgi:RHS repeat-associated protein